MMLWARLLGLVMVVVEGVVFDEVEGASWCRSVRARVPSEGAGGAGTMPGL